MRQLSGQSQRFRVADIGCGQKDSVFEHFYRRHAFLRAEKAFRDIGRKGHALGCLGFCAYVSLLGRVLHCSGTWVVMSSWVCASVCVLCLWVCAWSFHACTLLVLCAKDALSAYLFCLS